MSEQKRSLMHPLTRRGLLGRGLALGACGLVAASPLGLGFGDGARPARASSRFRPLEPYSSNELEARADELAQKLGIPVAKRQQLARKLRKTLWGSKFQRLLVDPGVTAVAVYRGGGGGLLVHHAREHGLVSYRHELETGEPPTPFDLHSTTFGAHIGGSGDWGVLLVVGLREAAGFGGQYRAKLSAATAAERSTVTATMYRHNVLDALHVHDIYFVGASEGLSADAGGGLVKIKVRPGDARDDDSKDSTIEASAELNASANSSPPAG